MSDSPESTQPRAGRTTVSARALRSLTTGLAGDCARVPRDEISVAVRDLDGALAVAVELPYLDSPSSGSVAEHGALVRDVVVSGMDRLAARTVRVVDVRFTAIRLRDRKRVT